jgi:hypothetical protein
MILDQKYPEADIKIHIKKLRGEFLKTFPSKIDLYNMIYESRFNRLWEQFRQNDR